MPPAKARQAQEDSRSEASTARERQVAAAAHARSKKNGAHQNGSSLKELALVSTESGNVIVPGQSQGMSWNTAPRDLLNTYRISHNISMPAAFTSPRNQALLSNPGIGRQSPTMARRKDKRRISKDQLALGVKKNFNNAAVSEIDVVVELVYKVRYQVLNFSSRQGIPNAVATVSREEAAVLETRATVSTAFESIFRGFRANSAHNGAT